MKSEKHKASDRAWYARNKERIKANLKEQYALDPVVREKKKQNALGHYQNNKEKKKDQSRRSLLKNKYGITPEQFEVMNATQEGLCAICKRPPEASDARKRRLEIDHNHTTGQIRKLLCHGCNVALGLFQDSSGILYRAMEYLNAHS